MSSIEEAVPAVPDCAHCHVVIESEQVAVVNGVFVHDDCIDDYGDSLKVACDDCGELCERDSLSLTNRNEEVCTDCIDYNYFACERCGDASHNDDGVPIHVLRSQQVWCESCAEDSFSCDNCNDSFSTRYHSPNWIDDCNYCDECLNEIGCLCEQCDEFFTHDEEHEHVIQSYGYKPKAIFHPESVPFTILGDGSHLNDASRGKVLGHDGEAISRASLAYYGIELETEHPISRATRDANAKEFSNRISTDDAYLKYDGSLNNGFEIVSHPRSLESWREFAPTFGEVLKDQASVGVRAWNTTTAGLHVHVSRVAFDGVSHVSRFALLFAKNDVEFETVASRKSDYASFQLLRHRGVVKKCAGTSYANHSDAINLSWPHTVEVRIFRPSLSINRVIGSIEIVASALEYTRNLTIKDINLGALTFERYSTWVHGNDYPLASRIIGGERFRLDNTLEN